ncbi:adenine nucleotide alpha hydrolase family protein [Ancylobacter lacus]|uniref:electron transfer flavoprotein subunit beta n=1 Tax=Ancylobacter lacus TaxID=2579970 RepID=UPI001BCC0505|nr:electron transfer flavoprotein subunit beta [Ancylobacter lacus]MBS7540161.1 electron transfer flavoprotein subunit beta [Ancylobacter lacus]
MKITVLLSAGRHPVSARPCPPAVELQALRLASGLAADITGLHAGPSADGVADALGHGLSTLNLLTIKGDSDPLVSLAATLKATTPDLILAGRQAQGGEDSGLLPYALARELGLPILADVVRIDAGGEGLLAVEQVLPRGARRRVVLRLPALLTVHPAAPAPLPFTFAAARRGKITQLQGVDSQPPSAAPEERPYRKRPKLIAKSAAGASAADRLKAATEAAAGGGRLLVNPAPAEAAREIITHLREIGVLRR